MTLANKQNLQMHMKANHEHKEQKISCDSCNKTFSDNRHLKDHVLAIHEGIKNFKCESCSKTFSQKGNLNRHVQAVLG